MREIAYAKLNLALEVRGREADGYHSLDTLFAFAEAGDLLDAAPAEALSLEITGPFAGALAAEPDNLVLRAARMLRDLYAVREGAALTLDKRLPVAAGLGGGSADAAAALRLLSRLWRIDAGEGDLLALAARLGADVPACFLSRTVRGTGRGDVLHPAPPEHRGAPVLIVNPGVPLSTAEVFRRWDGRRGGGNDLEPAAIALVPAIAEVLDALRAGPAARLVRMSGSGASCFALYAAEGERDAASAQIASAHPAWWRLASRLR